MSPIYDFECAACGKTIEAIEDIETKAIECECGATALRIITASGVHLGNEDASGWVKSVLEVVDKDSSAPHVRDFLKDPTRRNYKRWMKGEGLRPLEPGERTKPPPTDTSRIHQKVWERHRKRKRIEIG